MGSVMRLRVSGCSWSRQVRSQSSLFILENGCQYATKIQRSLRAAEPSMNTDAQLTIREATEAGLPGVLSLYSQPDLDGSALSPDAAREIFARFKNYPDYRLYVVVKSSR